MRKRGGGKVYYLFSSTFNVPAAKSLSEWVSPDSLKKKTYKELLFVHLIDLECCSFHLQLALMELGESEVLKCIYHQ